MPSSSPKSADTCRLLPLDPGAGALRGASVDGGVNNALAAGADGMDGAGAGGAIGAGSMVARVDDAAGAGATLSTPDADGGAGSAAFGRSAAEPRARRNR